ncbi:hypothetical protein ScPMuIL_000797 [Solemya velum]
MQKIGCSKQENDNAKLSKRRSRCRSQFSVYPKKETRKSNMASDGYRLSGEEFVISVEQERDSYKEKLEHLQSLLRRYEQELQSHKIRKEGVETVSKLLQEARQENVVLQRKNKNFESAIINLQNRLTTHGLSNSITTEEGELLVPGLSKQYLANLANENVRLRSLIRASSQDPEDIQQLKQNETRLLMELEEVKRERDEAEQRYKELETYLKSSDFDKDVQISMLGERMELVQRDYRAREVLCQSLSQESTKLRQQLKDVAMRCQQMALRMESKEPAKRTYSKDLDIEKLTKENQSLREKIAEIAEMNRRWQEYCSQKEKYIQQLKSAAPVSESSKVDPQRERELIGMTEALREQASRLEDEKKQMQTELHQTHQELVKLNEDKQDLQNRIASGSTGNGDEIGVLKAQIQLCAEDFASERRDREGAQSRIIELEAEAKQLRRERDNLLTSQQPMYHMRNYINDPVEEFSGTQYHHMNIPSSYQPENNLAARGVNIDELNVVDFRRNSIESDAPTKQKSVPIEDRSDSFPSLQTIPSLSESDSIKKPEEILKCPTCHKEYTADRHGELLEHMELCCD